jgi:hypothetical protein
MAEVFDDRFSSYDPTIYIAIVGILAAEIVLIVFPIVWKVRHVSFFVGSHCCLKRKRVVGVNADACHHVGIACWNF